MMWSTFNTMRKEQQTEGWTVRAVSTTAAVLPLPCASHTIGRMGKRVAEVGLEEVRLECTDRCAVRVNAA